MANFLSEVRNLRVFDVSNRIPNLRADFSALVRFWLGQRTSIDSSRLAASFLLIHRRLLTKPRGRKMPSKSRKPVSRTVVFRGNSGFSTSPLRDSPPKPYTGSN